jgi:hypothetical protein
LQLTFVRHHREPRKHRIPLAACEDQKILYIVSGSPVLANGDKGSMEFLNLAEGHCRICLAAELAIES